GLLRFDVTIAVIRIAKYSCSGDVIPEFDDIVREYLFFGNIVRFIKEQADIRTSWGGGGLTEPHKVIVLHYELIGSRYIDPYAKFFFPFRMDSAVLPVQDTIC